MYTAGNSNREQQRSMRRKVKEEEMGPSVKKEKGKKERKRGQNLFIDGSECMYLLSPCSRWYMSFLFCLTHHTRAQGLWGLHGARDRQNDHQRFNVCVCEWIGGRLTCESSKCVSTACRRS